jgi:TrmH family RNA methyltransferase
LIELVSRAVEPRQVGAKLFRALSSTETPQGVLALVKPPAADLAKMLASRSGEGALLVMLDGVQDPGNAGAIIRVGEAFGATGAIFLKGSVDPFHPRVLRGSAGSSFRLPILAGIEAEALCDLPLAALPIYAAMPRARSSVAIGSADFTTPCAIAIGGEGHGVRAALAAHSTPVHIATAHVESLNAAVAAGIFLYEARRQRESNDARRQTDARGEAGR